MRKTTVALEEEFVVRFLFFKGYGAAASMPLLPRRWQRVEMPVAELVVSSRMEGAGGARLLVCRETTRDASRWRSWIPCRHGGVRAVMSPTSPHREQRVDVPVAAILMTEREESAGEARLVV